MTDFGHHSRRRRHAEAATALLAAGATVTEVAQALNVSRATVYRHANP